MKLTRKQLLDAFGIVEAYFYKGKDKDSATQTAFDVVSGTREAIKTMSDNEIIDICYN